MPRRVALINDYEPFLEVLHETLDLQGYEVHARSREEVDLDALAAIGVHLIVIDPVATAASRLPSFTVLRSLRADRRFDAVPILVCAGANVIAEHSAELERLGKIHFLEKPFDALMLGTVVAALAHGEDPPNSELPE